jgi:hypothetical protein
MLGGWRSNCLSQLGGIRDRKRGMCAQFGGDGCCRLYLLSRLYWLRRLCFSMSKEPLDSYVCREQRAFGRLCFSVRNDFLSTSVFCGLLDLLGAQSFEAVAFDQGRH